MSDEETPILNCYFGVESLVYWPGVFSGSKAERTVETHAPTLFVRYRHEANVGSHPTATNHVKRKALWGSIVEIFLQAWLESVLPL